MRYHTTIQLFLFASSNNRQVIVEGGVREEAEGNLLDYLDKHPNMGTWDDWHLKEILGRIGQGVHTTPKT